MTQAEAYTQYTPTQTGNYTFQSFFGGQTLAGDNPTPGTTNPFVGDYYQPSQSEVYTLTVQQEPISYAATTPLPTEYWTRPIYAKTTTLVHNRRQLAWSWSLNIRKHRSM